MTLKGYHFLFFLYLIDWNVCGQELSNEEPDEQDITDNLSAEDIEPLKRTPKKMATLSDQDFQGVEKRKYDIQPDVNKRGPQRRTWFHKSHNHSHNLDRRGSVVKLSKKVQLLTPGDTEGCGNPMCVIIDSKPRRFLSLCAFVEFLEQNGRQRQMNFVQKGCCYDIMHGEGALLKQWTGEFWNCNQCLSDIRCNKPITVNIDIMSILYGQSSAFGGKTFHDITNPRMVGVPMEFDNICAFMQFMQDSENLNVKTQVIGFALGRRDDIFTTEANSGKCLWTEWFDHDTPCNNDGDMEHHTDHTNRLDGTMTGPLRICPADDIVETEIVGGSEITQVAKDDAINGIAVGSNGQQFRQILTSDRLSVKCYDTRQENGKLPPPFIFGEGIKGDNSKNASCLDYKIRYCCKTSTMYRPQTTQHFLSKVPPILPMGPMTGNATTNQNSVLIAATIRIHPVHGSSEPSATITLQVPDPASNEFTGVVDQGRTVVVSGTYEKIFRRANNRLKWVSYRFTLHREGSQYYGKVIFRYDIDDGMIRGIGIRNNNGKFAQSEVIDAKPDDIPIRRLRTILTDKKQRGKSLTITHEYDNNILGAKNITGNLDVTIGNPNGEFFQQVEQFVTEYAIRLFIESPPIALLFSECEWKDFVNLEYPGKYRTGAEWELRLKAAMFGSGGLVPKRRYFKEHVCGKVPEMALFVDAVSVENQIPWYELTHPSNSNQQSEVYKLSPFHGYICNDQNMLGNGRHCKDMKVRYCCAKELRAQWSEWGAWSSCTETCGCGYTRRHKHCVQSNFRKSSSALSKLAYNPTCHGDDTEANRRLFSEQTKVCNVEPCQVDFSWSPWSAWSMCSKTCRKPSDPSPGVKYKKRVCFPALNGGAECPDKKQSLLAGNLEDYIAHMDCTPPMCTEYYPGHWIGWSSCSATCGKGMRRRERLCYDINTMQPVSDKNLCGSHEGYMSQEVICKLQECPVDGGWCAWSEYSQCSQRCIQYPEESQEVATFAKRTRKRDCSCPLPAFGGMNCEHDHQFEWISHSNVQQDSKDCLTPRDVDVSILPHPPGGYAPWCPENCILTEWSMWSDCSAECIVTTIDQYEYNKINNKTDIFTNSMDVFGKFITIKPMLSFPLMPTRHRYRKVFKEARFHGTCFAESFWTDHQDENIIVQTEDCRLCDEHCNVHGQAGILDAVPLTYPGNDSQCVGFCPLDCVWHPYITEDCQDFKMRFFENPGAFPNFINEDDNQYMKDNRCYMSFVAKVLEQHLNTKLRDFMTELEAKILEAINKNHDYWIPMRIEDFDTFRDMFSFPNFLQCGICQLLKLPLASAWQTDRQMIINLHQTIHIKKAKLPNIDGFFGGEPCKRIHEDNKTLTVRRDNDPLFDPLNMHNLIPEDKKREWDNCGPTPLCEPPVHPPCPPSNPLYPDCPPIYPTHPCVPSWTDWGPWGQCDQTHGGVSCGGMRKRMRQCEDECSVKVCQADCQRKQRSRNHADQACMMECEANRHKDNFECRPFYNEFINKSFTDTDKTLCSPCFIDTPEWSQWGLWRFYNSSIDLCYEEGDLQGEVTQIRERVCLNTIKNQESCICDIVPHSAKDETREDKSNKSYRICEVETRTWPMTVCPQRPDICEEFCNGTTTLDPGSAEIPTQFPK